MKKYFICFTVIILILGFALNIKANENIDKVTKNFIKNHKGYGKFLNSEKMPDWAKGIRRKVYTAESSYLFYFYETNEKNEVVGVWEYLDDGTRKQKYHKDIPELPKNIEKKASNGIPKYKILDQLEVISGGIHGDVLISNFSQTKPSNEEQKKIFKKIMEKEDFSKATFYCTEKAFKANISSSYYEEHPDALNEGFLGKFDSDGNYYDNEDLGY